MLSVKGHEGTSLVFSGFWLLEKAPVSWHLQRDGVITDCDGEVGVP